MRRVFTTRRVIGLSAAVLLLLACFWVFSNGRYIQDQIAVWNYRVPDKVAAIAQRAQLTGQGEFLFYASTPIIDGTQEFNELCDLRDDEEGFNVLGCYDETTIVVFEITDERLDGMMQVTAAHELLHAVWSRTDQAERNRLSALLDIEYRKRIDDPKFAERMAWYDEREPGNRANELFAILGTEEPELSAELEEVYARYFQDRRVITGLHEKSEQVFTDLLTQTEQLNAQIEELTTQIEQRRSAYETALSSYNADVASFNAKAESGNFTSQAEFNAARSVLTARSSGLSAEKNAVNALVDTYNSILDQLNELNTTVIALQDSIDSTLAPQEQLSESEPISRTG